MNILTDILSLIKRKQYIKELKPHDVIVVGIHEEPEITGIASPIPYKNVKLIKAIDLAVKFDSCDFVNTPAEDLTWPGIFKEKSIDPATGECFVSLRKLKSLSLNLDIQLSPDGNYIEFNTTAEPNAAQNIDCGGVGLYADKVGEVLRFKSLLSSDGSLSFNDSGTCIDVTTNSMLRVQNTAFVDTTYGDDLTGEVENPAKPFATANAAEAAVTAGQTIVFRPGTHLISNLGKDGVTYYGLPGSILQGNGNADMWLDNNIAIRYDVVADKITTANGRWFYNINAGTVVHVEANEMYQTSFSTSKDAIYGRGTYYINVKNTVDVNADNWYLIQQESNGVIYFVGNHVKVRTRIANTNAGRIYYKANFSQSYSTNANENSFGSNGGGYVYIQDTYIRADNGVANYTGVIAPESGTIELVGCRIECTSTVRAPIDIGHVGNAGGVVIMRNCVVKYEAVANLPIVNLRSNANNKLIAYNTEFINLNTTANAHGIRTENTNANGSVELKDCVIKLHSDAVALGAKALKQQSGTLTYKALSDIWSNGAYDGTNLIASTGLFVDPNVKSN